MNRLTVVYLTLLGLATLLLGQFWSRGETVLMDKERPLTPLSPS